VPTPKEQRESTQVRLDPDLYKRVQKLAGDHPGLSDDMTTAANRLVKLGILICERMSWSGYYAQLEKEEQEAKAREMENSGGGTPVK
jgi:hypothetical protein